MAAHPDLTVFKQVHAAFSRRDLIARIPADRLLRRQDSGARKAMIVPSVT